MVVIRDYTGQGQEKREERVNATVCAVLEGFPSLTMRGWVIQRSLSSVPPDGNAERSRYGHGLEVHGLSGSGRVNAGGTPFPQEGSLKEAHEIREGRQERIGISVLPGFVWVR